MNTELSSFAARLRFADPRQIPDPEFNTLALDLFALQFHCNPAYQKICNARRLTPDNVTHWTQIPSVPTAAFKELELSCIPPNQRTAVFHSSGTSEQIPSRHFHCAESLEVYEASLWSWFAPNVTLGGDFDLLLLTPPPVLTPHSSLVHMFEIVRRKLRAPHSSLIGSLGNPQTANQGLEPETYIPAQPPIESPRRAPHTSLGQSESASAALGSVHPILQPPFVKPREARIPTPAISLNSIPPASSGTPHPTGPWTLDFNAAIASLKTSRLPKLILGTAFSFVHLLDHLAAQNLQFQLPPGSRVMETGGYKNRSRTMPKSELHSTISASLGVPLDNIICEYGMSELSSQAYDGGQMSEIGGRPRPFRFPPWARVRIVSPENGQEVADGETGLIRIFDLANVFSVAAIQTEDLAVRRGTGFELIGRAPLAESRGCSLMTA